MEPKYRDIVALPHPTSETHPPMSRHHRAAQFAPFAAVVGHEAAVAETARLTERRREIEEDALAELDRRWREVCASSERQPLVEITYFVPDARKDGGAYRTVKGHLTAYHRDENIVCVNGTVIPLADVTDIRKACDA